MSNLGYSERVVCRVSGVSRSFFYEHKYHVPSDRYIRRLLLMGLVADIHKRSRGAEESEREGKPGIGQGARQGDRGSGRSRGQGVQGPRI